MQVYHNGRQPCYVTKRARKAYKVRLERKICRRQAESLRRYEKHCKEVMRLAYLKHLPMYRTYEEYETFTPMDEMIY